MKIGTIIESRFEIQARIKSSGRNRVFRGVDLETGRPVAVKILDGMGAHARRFARESVILNELSNPGIVKYVANGMAGGRLYLVMDWIEGCTLSHKLSTGLTIREAVMVARRIADALAPVHARGVVHRDIKPSNIMFASNALERVVLLDFGIARHVGELGTATRTGMILGTPGYMSPEQAVGSRAVDARSDVFSLGCVLYTCIAGSAAFSGAHMPTTLTAILFFDPPPLSSRCPEAPPALIDVVERMMAKDPDLRPADAVAVMTALDALGPLPDVPRRPFRSGSPAPRPKIAVDSPDTASTMISSGPPLADGSEAAPVFILASLDPDSPDLDPVDGTTADGADSTLGELVRPVRELVTFHRGLSAILADGMFVAMFPSAGIFGRDRRAEQLARVAECALSLRATVPHAPIVIGRADTGPAIAVLDRLVESLIEESFRDIFDEGAGGGAGKPIRLATQLADVLDGSFPIQRSGMADYLVPPVTETADS